MSTSLLVTETLAPWWDIEIQITELRR